MLYQDKILGRSSLLRRVRGRVAQVFGGHKPADLDLVALNPHLSRDLGLWDGQAGMVAHRRWTR